jgi:hypothetical protein
MQNEHQAQQEKELSWWKETVLSHVLLVYDKIREQVSNLVK